MHLVCMGRRVCVNDTNTCCATLRNVLGKTGDIVLHFPTTSRFVLSGIMTPAFD
jgi:hypothetical protein